jgi:hypothetical protein
MSHPSPEAPPFHQPVHNVLFSIPRTASHLLTQLLNLPAQPSILRPSNNKDGYHFLPAIAQRFRRNLTERPISEWSADDKTTFQAALQSSFDAWIALLDSATRSNKSTYTKEHINWILDPALPSGTRQPESADSSFTLNLPSSAFSTSFLVKESHDETRNLTCLPTPFLLHAIRPTFLIRHPALTFPSCLRTSIDIEGLETAIASERTQRWECTFVWSLALYRLYTDQKEEASNRATLVDGIEYPIVLDAADLGNERLVGTYTRAVGLDADMVRFQWDVAGVEERAGLGSAELRMKSSIMASRGVQTEKLDGGDLDVKALAEAWKEEFGEVLADRLLELVEASMPAYEDLRGVRLRVD